MYSGGWWWRKRNEDNIADMIDRALTENDVDDFVEDTDVAWEDIEKLDEDREIAEELEDEGLEDGEEKQDVLKKMRALADLMEEE